MALKPNEPQHMRILPELKQRGDGETDAEPNDGYGIDDNPNAPPNRERKSGAFRVKRRRSRISLLCSDTRAQGNRQLRPVRLLGPPETERRRCKFGEKRVAPATDE